MLSLAAVVVVADVGAGDADLYRDEGDAKRKAEDYAGALKLYLKAAEARPDDPFTHLRIAITCEKLTQREPGLTSLNRYLAAKPEKKDDPKIKGLLAALSVFPEGSGETLPKAAQPKPMSVEDKIALRAVHQLCAAMQKAFDAGDKAKGTALAVEAREQLMPFLADSESKDLERWKHAAVIAGGAQDAQLAAFAVEAISRLHPNLDGDERAMDLLARLSRMPIRDKVKSIPDERRRLAELLTINPANRTTSSCLELARCRFNGLGVTPDEAAGRTWVSLATKLERKSVDDRPPRKFKNGIEFIWIKRGCFVMGSPETEKGRVEDERLSPVWIWKGFYLAKTETTQAQWNAVMKKNPSRYKGDNAPVENVSWNDAMAFCRAFAQNARLPSEEEWEYACRADTSSAFNGGKELRPSDGWFDKLAESGATHEVAAFRPNPWGLYDMHGNVSEWCMWYPDAIRGDFAPKRNRARRVARGGSWLEAPNHCRSAYHRSFDPDWRDENLGFRVALDDEQPAIIP
jgi:formylglycine-generating enzyme required for sulfatase activity